MQHVQYRRTHGSIPAELSACHPETDLVIPIRYETNLFCFRFQFHKFPGDQRLSLLWNRSLSQKRHIPRWVQERVCDGFCHC